MAPRFSQLGYDEMGFEEIPPPPYYMRLLDETGDTAITWAEPDDVDVLTYIQKKMDEGYVFFVERPRAVRAFMKRKKINDVSEVKERKLIVADTQANDLALEGKITLTTLKYAGGDDVATVKKATTAKEVATSRTIATRPLRGG